MSETETFSIQVLPKKHEGQYPLILVEYSTSLNKYRNFKVLL